METKVMGIEEGLKLAKRLILGGEVVAFPTETVYGLGANALCDQAVKKIFSVKGRPSDNPLIVHVDSKEAIYRIASYVSEDAKVLIKNLMPGPLTLVLNKSDIIPYSVTAGLNTVAVRMPSHPAAKRLIEYCGVPIAAPSANISAHISPTSAEHVYRDLNGRIALIIDGGNSDVGIESTVLDMSGDDPIILRPGSITSDIIESLLNKKVTIGRGGIDRPSSPGMKYRHYAPISPMEIIDNQEEIISRYDDILATGLRPVIITAEGNYTGREVIIVGSSGKEIAKNVYGALRQAELKYDYIISELFDKDLICQSVMNRLYKAAEGQKDCDKINK